MERLDIFVSVALKDFNMPGKIKDIIGVFLKIPGEEIVASTFIDRNALGSSILLHRMYAKLASAGIEIADYQEIKCFGDLLQRLPGSAGAGNIVSENAATQVSESVMAATGNSRENKKGVGIDIEQISSMPPTDDFREDIFYQMNFTAAEIAYCILQSNPYASFGGLFAAKEAIIKADNSYRNKKFNTIQIQHSPEGKPFHQAFSISISHTPEIAVAVAMPAEITPQLSAGVVTGLAAQPTKMNNRTPVVLWVLVLISIVLSAAAIFLIANK